MMMTALSGLGFRFWGKMRGLGFRSLGFRIWGKTRGLGFGSLGLGFRV